MSPETGFLKTDGTPEAAIPVFSRFPGEVPLETALEARLVEVGAPAILGYSWLSPVVVVGYGQKISGIDLDFCRLRRMPVIRRVTGGTGVVHHRDLSLSLVLPADHRWARSIPSLYDAFLDVLLVVLNDSGAGLSRPEVRGGKRRPASPICFEDQLADTLSRDGRKAVGCAQLRRKKSVLIHAAINLNLDIDLYAAVFRVGSDRIERHLCNALQGAAPASLFHRLSEALADALGMQPRRIATPPLEEEWRRRYERARWFPLQGGGMGSQ